jgi:SAM-dependent methyltransferase
MPPFASIGKRNARAWMLFSRAGYDVCRDYQTAPAFFEMLPEVCGLTELLFPAASFDFIIAFTCFMDVAAPERLLVEIVRALKPGVMRYRLFRRSRRSFVRSRFACRSLFGSAFFRGLFLPGGLT